MTGCHVKPEQVFNLILGYNDDYLEQASNTNAAAGNNFLYGTVVPADEVWVVCGISGINVTRAITQISGGIYNGSTYHALFGANSPAASQIVYCPISLIVGPGNKVYAIYIGCTAGDDIYLNIAGYKVKLTQ
jgi:hypothetical protein